MKKKGRICGTIGLVLSLVLAGGTVVYGTFFHKNAAGLAKKPIGSSTGNYFVSWVKGNGFDKTYTLVKESESALTQTTSSATYKSYTLDFTVAETDSYDGTIINQSLSGTAYVDEDYTYVATTERIMAGRTVKTAENEYIFVKKTNAVYVRSNPVLTENTADAPLLDTSDWKLADDSEGIEIVSDLISRMSSVLGSTDQVSIDYLTGQYHFDDKNTLSTLPEGSKAKCYFTVGYSPMVRYELSYKTEEDKANERAAKEGNAVYTLQYSNLNNTKVNLPDSLDKILNGEASK